MRFLDEEGAEFELVTGLRESIYRKDGKTYRIFSEPIVGGLGSYVAGKAFWFEPSGVPHEERPLVQRDISKAFKELNQKAVFE